MDIQGGAGRPRRAQPLLKIDERRVGAAHIVGDAPDGTSALAQTVGVGPRRYLVLAGVLLKVPEADEAQ